MQVSAQKLNATIERQVFSLLHQMLADTRDNEEIKTVMEGLLKPDEHAVMAKRLAIAIYLDKKRSYTNIKQMLKVSSATIAAVAKMMNSEGMKLALNKIKAEEWADGWAEKLGSLMRGLVK